MTKLECLAAIEGYDSVEDLLEAFITDSVCPAICTNEGCDYTEWLEPDQDRGWCEECGTNTLSSAMILARVI